MAFFGSTESQELVKDIIKKAAHPEDKIFEEIKWMKKEAEAHFLDTVNYITSLEKSIDKLNNKVDLLLDLKTLKEKIDKLVRT